METKLLFVLAFSSLVPADICPRGYWPATVYSKNEGNNIGQYSSDRDFYLSNGPHGNEPVCQFCPGISCFIVQQEPVKADEEKEVTAKRRPRPHPLHQTTTKTPQLDDLFTSFENLSATKSPKSSGELETLMSCARLSDLTYPHLIVTYLDCVLIGQRDLYYLFIYTPTSRFDIKPVDNIDPDFLKWIPRNTELRGIELGFPMLRLPPYFFRYNREILLSTEQVCFDSSAMKNNELNPSDMESFKGNALAQVVFRHKGLQRDRLPPNQPNGTVITSHVSDEEIDECPSIAYSQPPKTYPNKDCRYSASVMRSNGNNISQEEVHKSCTSTLCYYEKPVIIKTRKERKALPVPRYVSTLLNASLIILVLLLIFGTVLSFCLQNREKAMSLFLTRRRKRMLEAIWAAEAAERAAREAEEANNAAWNPFGRYAGLSTMAGGAMGFGFGARLPFPNPSQQEKVQKPVEPARGPRKKH